MIISKAKPLDFSLVVCYNDFAGVTGTSGNKKTPPETGH